MLEFESNFLRSTTNREIQREIEELESRLPRDLVERTLGDFGVAPSQHSKELIELALKLRELMLGQALAF